MFLKKLTILNYKNIRDAVIEFPEKVTCVTGENGSGKTNLIDAIHFLSMGRSSVPVSDKQCICHGEDFFMTEGRYESDSGRTDTVVCSVRPPAGKSLKKNGKPYEKLSDHIGTLPLVMVAPADTFLISDAAEERRRYLNSFLSQFDKAYLQDIIRYGHILTERNRLLKDMGGTRGEILDVLDDQLSAYAGSIYEKRKALIGELAPMVSGFYAELASDREQVELSYRSELAGRSMKDILDGNREKDMVMRHTTGGIHRDEVMMKIGGMPLRKYGSQGQQKSFLIALKLAQHKIVADHCGETPILLLDDLFDKLDGQRVSRLLAMVSGGAFGQIFITDCNRRRISEILDSGGQKYGVMEVADGKIRTV